jgi:hypothetical protein
MDSQTKLEIQDFNTKKSKKAKLFKNLELVGMSFNRKCSTNHGLHLNNAGKESLAKAIASQINKIINCSSNENPISLQWKEKSNNESITENMAHSPSRQTAVDNSPKLESPQIQNLDHHQESLGSECTRRTSTRQKKAIIPRHSDFLWSRLILTAYLTYKSTN